MTSSTVEGFVSVRSSDTGKEDSSLSYTATIDAVRDTFKSGKTKSLAWRKKQLKQIRKLFAENHEAITAAVRKDHGGPKFRGIIDIASCMSEIDIFEANLDAWARDMPVKHDSIVGKSYVKYEPKGVVLIIAPWNFPFAMVFDPLVGILAAGNCAVIKPSEVSVNSCNLMAELIPKYLDNDAVKVVTGGVSETTALLKERFDHIMYTGNGFVGRIVMRAAAEHLTPVTLELGGKSPVYVDKSANLKVAVSRVAMSKYMNCGQICIAPDYILVHEKVADEFQQMLQDLVTKTFGKTVKDRQSNKDYARIINPRHAERISNLVGSTSGKVILGESSTTDESFCDPTIIVDPSLTDSVLKEEIFGPVLPILRVKSVQEATEKVREICEKPLALYVFAEDRKTIQYFVENTQSGGVAVNTTLEQQNNHHLPFGGIGESGLGTYHGRYSFEEFSHKRGVLERGTFFYKGATLPLPPYHEKFYDLAIKYTVTGFLSENQKKVLKFAGVGAAAAAGFVFFNSRL